jgi:hypothetical protein
MDIPHDLVAQLADLTDALDEDGTDLQAVLSVLIDDLMTAVPSFLGLTMHIQPNGTDSDGLTLDLLPPTSAARVETSLLMPLHVLGVSRPCSLVVFYAAQPGAFVDLAADTRHLYGLDGQVVLDQHLPTAGSTAVPTEVFGHTGTTAINRAIGVLIERGNTPEQARDLLHRHADQHGIPLQVVAQKLLDDPGA